VSLELDGELSDFERTLLGAHLAECGECRSFRDELVFVTGELRAAPLEQPARQTYLPRRRRRPAARLAPAAAAFALVAVGVTTLVGSLGSGELLDTSAAAVRPANVDQPDLIRRFQLRQQAALDRAAVDDRRVQSRAGGFTPN
jgi:predicted anti-sigma-YlaC factor YlaD